MVTQPTKELELVRKAWKQMKRLSATAEEE